MNALATRIVNAAEEWKSEKALDGNEHLNKGWGRVGTSVTGITQNYQKSTADVSEKFTVDK